MWCLCCFGGGGIILLLLLWLAQLIEWFEQNPNAATVLSIIFNVCVYIFIYIPLLAYIIYIIFYVVKGIITIFKAIASFFKKN